MLSKQGVFVYEDNSSVANATMCIRWMKNLCWSTASGTSLCSNQGLRKISEQGGNRTHDLQNRLSCKARREPPIILWRQVASDQAVPSVVHLYLSSTSPWVNPRDTPRTRNPQEPRRNGTVLVFLFFPRGEGEGCLVFRTTLLDYGHICRRALFEAVRHARWKLLYLVPWLMRENKQTACKKNWIHLFLTFTDEK